jgi:DNA-binding MarR family transcriptional regulator
VSVRVLTQVFADPNARLARRLILIVLADAASDDGVTWIGQAEIAEKAGLTRTHVTRELGEMAAAGAVQVRKAQRGRKRISVYRVTVPGLAEVDYERLPFTLDQPFDDVRNSHTVGDATTCDPRSDDVRSTQMTTCAPRTSLKKGVEPPGEPSENREAREQALARRQDDQLEIVVEESTDQLVGYFVDVCRSFGVDRPDGRTIAILGRTIKALLEEGRSGESIRAGVDRMLERRIVQPALLGQFMIEAALPVRATRPGGRVTADELLRRARHNYEEGN